jgi:hypothetical protein
MDLPLLSPASTSPRWTTAGREPGRRADGHRIIDEDAAIDSAFFGSHAGRSCYALAHRSGWVLVERFQIINILYEDVQ